MRKMPRALIALARKRPGRSPALQATRGGTVNGKSAMSIILAAAGEPGPAGQFIFAVFLLTGAGLVAWLLGVLRPRSIHGPPRLAPRKGFGLALSAAAGVLVWIGMQMLYVIHARNAW